MSFTTAICSFCSREDNSVKVVCKKYCLICHRCQVLPATKQLLIDHYLVNDPNSYNNRIIIDDVTEEVLEKSQCPLCGSHMTRNMFISVQSLMETANIDDGNKISMFLELDLGYKTNPFKEFVNYFKLTYGNIGYEIKTESAIDKNKLVVDGLSNNNLTSESKLHHVDSKLSFSSSSDEDQDEDFNTTNQSNIKKSSRPASPLNKSRPVSPKIRSRPTSSKGVSRPESPTAEEKLDNAIVSNQNLPAIPQQSPQTPNILGKIDFYASLPPVLSTSEGLNVIAECYYFVWQSLIRGSNDSIAAAVLKICHRKKSSIRSNDFKLKSFLDFIVSVNTVNNPNRSATTLLFGRLIGTNPRFTDSIRPVLGSISTIILVIAYCSNVNSKETKQIFDVMNGIPSAIDFKTKLDKFSVTRTISLKRAIQIIEYLVQTQQPHWIMAPLMASNVGSGSILAWGKDSMSRLIHLIIYVIQGDIGNSNNKSLDKNLLKGFANTSFASNALSNKSMSTTNNLTSNILSNKQVYKRLINLSNKAKEFWNAISNDQWSNTLDSNSLGFIINNNLTTDQSTNNSSSYDLKQHTSFQSFVNLSDQQIDSPYILSAKFKAKSTGKGVFSQVNINDFNNSNYGDMNISITEFIFICNVAWEEEYELLLKHQNSTELTKLRRVAITSTFDKDTAKITIIERNILKKIIKYWNLYHDQYINRNKKKYDHDVIINRKGSVLPDHIAISESYINSSIAESSCTSDSSVNIGLSIDTIDDKSIDWEVICQLAKDNELPFNVPPSLYTKTPAELNYHISIIMRSEDERINQELKDDKDISISMNGPYSKLPFYIDSNKRVVKRINNPNNKRMVIDAKMTKINEGKDFIVDNNIVSPVVMSDQEKLQIERADYLSKHTLGDRSLHIDLSARSINQQSLLTSHVSDNFISFDNPRPMTSPANSSKIHKLHSYSTKSLKTVDMSSSNTSIKSYNKLNNSKMYNSPKPIKFDINLADIIDFHPNLLTKVKLLDKNELMKSENGNLTFSSNASNRTDTSNGLNDNDRYMNKIFEKHKERLNYGVLKPNHVTTHSSNRIPNSASYHALNHTTSSSGGYKVKSIATSTFKIDNSTLENKEFNDPIFYRPMSQQSKIDINTNSLDEDASINEIKSFTRRISDLNSKVISKHSSYMTNSNGNTINKSDSASNDNEPITNQVTVNNIDSRTRRRSSMLMVLSKDIDKYVNKLNPDSNIKSTSNNSLDQLNDDMIDSNLGHYIQSLSLEFNIFINDLYYRYNNNLTNKSINFLSTSTNTPLPSVTNTPRRSSINKQLINNNYIVKGKFSLSNQIDLNIENDFNYIITHFYNKVYNIVKYLYLTNCNLNYLASDILLASNLSKLCQIIELNLSSNVLGDKGCKNILNAIVQGSGQLVLIKLNISRNNIALASDSMSVLSEFKNLRYLDMSYNRISIDITRQIDLFCKIFKSLNSLRVLSLSNNTLQDNATEYLYNIMFNDLNSINQLVLLDISKCYLTAKSLTYIQLIIDNKMKKLTELWINNNMFTSDQIKKLRYVKYANLKTFQTNIRSSINDGNKSNRQSFNNSYSNEHINSNNNNNYLMVHIDDKHIELCHRSEFTIDYLNSL